ncbi:type I-E CRISPR-associated protein Cse2/CasB [Deinococcus soli (ex Cha et al. 2016)]|uniref:CRISPR type I-E-associated protein CasB/Cse2 n=2 Tax=Deinococcus soli (ex Cha et al. 2016) TaxID=1309411 RepID=A0AAE3XDI0_9DEIO|nr:type I-E CRISPR-associated protein Cse2/CasB [Deinococcus soli (ex Cha et al. 2016)]MDR6218924.1 CRISPR type I-E-associated protein CasB/Cse2 [Deinococcus soli (ex Cha et al. 2016)]MDR6328721.1 CRISPR type I-E-associated protein CasB/Cse2 [Deinococcus soli (ex Cha et al. 2016)]MDR6751792.1 CRISPR type I-E-associated protein CasB/Cse2 [Deinococcus soli (ex Cha et al. 2016)]
MTAERTPVETAPPEARAAVTPDDRLAGLVLRLPPSEMAILSRETRAEGRVSHRAEGLIDEAGFTRVPSHVRGRLTEALSIISHQLRGTGPRPGVGAKSGDTRVNLGAALARRDKAEGGRSGARSMDRLMRAEPDSLMTELRRAVSVVNSVNLNWADLIRAAATWHRPDDRAKLQRQWARAFHEELRATRPQPASTPTGTSPDQETP